MRIDDELRHAADAARSDEPPRNGDGELLDRAAERIQALEKAGRAVHEARLGLGITTHDAPSDRALEELRELTKLSL